MARQSLLFALCVFVLFGCSSKKGADKEEPRDKEEKVEKPKELKQLDVFVGDWTTKGHFKKAEWFPEEVRVTGSATCAWVLDGRFVLGKGTDTSKTDFQVQWGFDPDRKLFRSWFFNTNGHAGSWTGTWDAKTRTFTLATDLLFTEPPDGRTETMRVKVVDADTLEHKVLGKKKDGTVLIDFEGTWKRKK